MMRQSVSEENGGPYHVAIIGGGITGLSTAWYLQQAAETDGLPLCYTLLEQSGRWGGKILTHREPGSGREPFIVEAGPDSFLTQKPWAMELACELGLESEFLPTNDAQRQVFVLRNGRLVPMPEGIALIVPTRIGPFMRSPLISLPGKLRMALELFIPARRDGADETLADFVTRRLGREALDRLAEPLMSGIYSAEADRQSILATFPRFRALEEQHGSLIRGMLAARRAQATAGSAGRAAPSMFLSFRQGMETLVNGLLARLHGDLRLSAPVQTIRPENGRYCVVLADGAELPADAVVLAVPAYVAARLLGEAAPQAAPLFETIRYVSTGTLSLGFRRDEIAHPLNGFGLVIPASEQRPLNAVTWSSTKFDHRAPAGHVLLRLFFGGSRNPQMMEKTDAELLAAARRELRQLLGITAAPVFERVDRWPRANPQYDVGHLERVAAIEKALPAALYVTGSPYRGIGIPDCVHQAQQTAGQIITRLHETARPAEEHSKSR